MGALLAGLVSTTILTLSAQGPATLLVAFAAVLALRLLQWQGPQRIWVAVGLGSVTAISVALTVLGLFGIGPVTRTWESQESTAFRKSFWDVGWRIMEALPLFDTGPGGLSRYVGEYRSEQYVREQGSDIYIDAAHNVPIQYGATMGVVGLVLAIVLLGPALTAAVAVAWRAQAERWVISAAGSMLSVYIAQSLISIDEIRLKEIGWATIGVVVALARTQSNNSSLARKDNSDLWLSPAFGLAGLLVCMPSLWVTAQQATATSVEHAISTARNPILSCERRMQLVSNLAQVASLKDTWAVASQVASIDVRCPALAGSYSELAYLAGEYESADRLAFLSEQLDPLSPPAVRSEP